MPSNKLQEIASKIYFGALLCICATLPFNSIALNSIGIILLVIARFLEGNFPSWKVLQKNKLLLAFLFFYLVHVIFLINTENMKNGMFELEKKLSLLVFPLVVLTKDPLDKKKQDLLLLAFSLACLCMVFYSLWQIAEYHFNGGKPLLYKNQSFDYREYFVQIAERHPTYASMYLLFSCISLWGLVEQKVAPRLLSYLAILIFLVTTFLLSSRLVIVGSLVIFASFSAFNYTRVSIKTTLLSFGLVLASTILTALVVWNVPSIKSRLVEEFFDAYTFAPARGIHYNSLNTRISETLCGIDIIRKNPLVGVGTGDVQDELNACYEAKEYSSVLYTESYNPHNQFIHTYAGLGLLGILTLLFLLYLLFKKSDPKNKIEFSYIVCITFLLFFTETFFGFQKGIVFFSLFTTLLSVKKM